MEDEPFFNKFDEDTVSTVASATGVVAYSTSENRKFARHHELNFFFLFSNSNICYFGCVLSPWNLHAARHEHNLLRIYHSRLRACKAYIYHLKSHVMS
jgi:hypothetical protein